MLGYQWVRDHVDISLSAGVDFINHKITPFDTTNPVNGQETGFKVAGDIETRTFALNLPYYFLLDADYSTAFDSYYVLEPARRPSQQLRGRCRRLAVRRRER